MDASFSPEPAPPGRRGRDRTEARRGWLEVICGPMFSGKTEELIRRLRRATLARQEVAVFKPQIDQRYQAGAIVSHSQQSLVAQPIAHAGQVLERLEATCEVVGIDEAQFFDAELVAVVQALAEGGRRVVVAGLDQDFTGAPFEPMPALMAVAECVTKATAVCMVCGAPAGRTQRLGTGRRQVLVGAHDRYEARCRRCHRSAGAAARPAAPRAGRPARVARMSGPPPR